MLLFPAFPFTRWVPLGLPPAFSVGRSQSDSPRPFSLSLSFVLHPFIFSWLRLFLSHACHLIPLQYPLPPPLPSLLSQSTLVPRLICSSSVIQINWPAFLILSLLNPPLHSVLVCVCVFVKEGHRQGEIRHSSKVVCVLTEKESSLGERLDTPVTC